MEIGSSVLASGFMFMVVWNTAFAQSQNNAYVDSMQKKFTQANESAAAQFEKQYPKPKAPVIPEAKSFLAPAIVPPETSHTAPHAAPVAPALDQPKAAQLPGPANVPGMTPPVNIYASPTQSGKNAPANSPSQAQGAPANIYR